jgi:hypothetical protein
MATRYALYSRFEEDGNKLILRTEYFSVQAGEAAITAGWDLIGEEPDYAAEAIEAHRLSEEHKWDRALKERR